MRWLVVLVLFLPACDEPPERGASPSPSASAAEAGQASSCRSMCERAASCGVEIAADLAETAGSDAQQAVARAKTDAASQRAACTERCGAATMTERDVIMAKRCLAKEACRDFVTCLDEG